MQGLMNYSHVYNCLPIIHLNIAGCNKINITYKGKKCECRVLDLR